MIRLLDRISITRQFMVLFAMAVMLMASGTGMALMHSYEMDFAAKKAQVRSLAESGQAIAEYYVAQAQSGALSTQAAQAQALAALSAMRYDQTNYFFVAQDDGTILADANKAWIGTNQMNFVDAEGTPVLQPLIQSAVAGTPQFNSYDFPKAPGLAPELKVSLGLAVPQWHWVICTGLYVSDIRLDILHIALGLAEIFMPLFLVFMWIVLTMRGRLAWLLHALSDAMGQLADGALGTEIPAMDRGDEIGEMARAVQVFKDNGLEKLRLETEAAQNRTRAEEDRKRSEAEREAAAKQLAFVVDSVAAGLEKLSRGDLLFRLNTGFESAYEKLRSDFNAAMDRLQETMKAITSNTQDVRTGVEEITQASDDLSRRTEQTAATLEETAAALDQITATVRKTAEGAARRATLSRQPRPMPSARARSCMKPSAR